MNHYHKITNKVIGEPLLNRIDLIAKDSGYISLLSWLDNQPELQGRDRVIYDRYLMFCIENKLKSVSKNKFSRFLRGLGYALVPQRYAAEIYKVYKYKPVAPCPACGFVKRPKDKYKIFNEDS